MVEATQNTSKSFALSAVFSLLLILSLIVFYGPGVHLILFGPAIILLANIFFINWYNGESSKAIARIAISSLGFVITIFILSVVWIKVFPSGQVGYGDKMQISGQHITLLGYGTLLKWSGFLGLMAFGSAVFVSLFMRGKNDNFI